MRHLLLATLLSVFSLPAAASDDDYELADLLLKRGWYDLAEDLFRQIKKDTSLSREKRSEAEYGLARVPQVRAERTRNPEEQISECDKAIKAIQKFIDANSNHPRKAEALANIGELRQLKGKALVQRSKTDPDALDLAEDEFDKAEASFEKQIKDLEDLQKSRGINPPDAEDRVKNPSKYKRDAERWDAFEQSMMFAKYNKGIAIFNRAETYRENPDKHDMMKKKLTEMIALFSDFMWDYSTYFLAYDAAIYMGRASMLLARYSDRAKAERYWANCFRYIGTSKSPLKDPEDRRNEMVRNLGTRGYYYEIKARIGYGDTKKGRAATREYLAAAKLAEELFRLIPSARKTNMGKAVALEQAKAYCKGGKTKEGIALLNQLIDKNKDSWVESNAFDILGEYAGGINLGLAIQAADNIFNRGVSWLTRALPKYRAALNSIKSEKDKKEYYAYCWYQIGQCYYYLDRYEEASIALEKIIHPGSPWLDHDIGEIAGPAARLRLQALKRLVSITNNPQSRQELDRYRPFVTKRYASFVGQGEIAGQAIDLENNRKYLESNALWEKLAKPGNPDYEEAIFSIGQNYYKYAIILSKSGSSEADRYFEKALRQFKKHLTYVQSASRKTKAMVRNAVGSILFSCRIHGDERFSKGNPQEALRISDKMTENFPKADPKLLISIMSTRLNAKLRLAKSDYWYCRNCEKPVKPGNQKTCPECQKGGLVSYLQEAQKDMEVLETNFKEIGLGRRDYLRALALLAGTLEESAAELAGSDPRLAKQFTLQAIEYYVKYTQEDDTALQGKKLLYMAEKLFAAAEELLDSGTDMARKKAKSYAEKAGDLLKDYIENEGGLENEDPAQARQIRRMITRTNVMSGNFDEAIKDLRDLVLSDEEMADGSTWEDLADCYKAKAQTMNPSEERTKLYKDADQIYAKLASALFQGNRVNEHFYRLLYSHAQCLDVIGPNKLETLFKRGEGPPGSLFSYFPPWVIGLNRSIISMATAESSKESLWTFILKTKKRVNAGMAATRPQTVVISAV